MRPLGLSLGLSLAPRLLRSPVWRHIGFVTAGMFGCLVAAYIALAALNLTGGQVADRDLGRYDVMAEAGEASVQVPPGDDHRVLAAAAAARRAGASDVFAGVKTLDVQPASADPPFTRYLEGPWTTDPFPRRFSLSSGRWPSAAGEVAVSRSLLVYVKRGQLPVLAGNATFTVTGVTRDRYGADARIFAAPGTWNQMDPVALRRTFPTLIAAPVLLWSGGGVQHVAHAAATRLAAPGAPDVDAALSLATRQDVEVTPEQGFLGSMSQASTLLAFGVILLGVCITFMYGAARLGGTTRALLDVGVPRRAVRDALSGAAAAASAVAGVVGIAGGLLAGLVVFRPLVARLTVEPLSPVPHIGGLLAALAGFFVISCAAGTALVRMTTSIRKTTGDNAARARVRRQTRRALIGAGALAIITQIGTLNAVSRAMLFVVIAVGVILLATPEALTLACRLLPNRDLRWTLSRRQLQQDRQRAALSIAVLTAALGVPLAFLTLLSTAIAAAQADEPSFAPRGQVVVNGDSLDKAPSSQVLKVVAAQLHGRAPIRVGYLIKGQQVVTLKGDRSTLLVVPQVADLERLNDHPLTDRQRAVLRRGGVLLWSNADSATGDLLVESTATGLVRRSVPSLPVGMIDMEPFYRTSTSGVLLAGTAERLSLPLTADSKAAYVHLGSDEPNHVRRAVVAAGYDPYPVAVYREPAVVRAPLAYLLAGGALAALVLSTVIGMTRSQAESFRRICASLLALGIPVRWAGRVLAVNVGVLITVTSVLSGFIAVPIVAFVVSRIPGYQLFIPWGWLTTVLAAFYTAAALATGLSMRNLRPGERAGV